MGSERLKQTGYTSSTVFIQKRHESKGNIFEAPPCRTVKQTRVTL